MSKVLILNCAYSSNLGDQAIGIAMKNAFENVDFEVVLKDLTQQHDGRDFYDSTIKNTNDKPKSKIPKWISNFKTRLRWSKNNNPMFSILTEHNFSAIIIGGGELIQSNTIFPVAINTWIKKAKKANRDTKVVLFGVGVTDNYSLWDKLLLKKALRFIDFSYVRDSASIVNIKKNFNISSVLIPDIVFSLAAKGDLKNKKNRALLGITKYSRIQKHKNIDVKSKSEYYDKLFTEYHQLQDKYSIVTVIYADRSDLETAIDFKSYAYEKYNATVDVANYKDINGMFDLISSSELVISPRMHTCIFSLLSEVDVKPIVMSGKMDSFVRRYILNSVKMEDLNSEIKQIMTELKLRIDGNNKL